MNKENSAPARLFPTTEENPVSPLAGAGAFVWRHQFFGDSGKQADMGLHTLADQDVECARVRADFSKLKGGASQMQSHVVVPGADASELVTRYSLNGGGTFSDLAPVPINVANPNAPNTGARLLLPDAAAVSNILLKLVRRGGDGIIKPSVWNAIVEVASGAGGVVPSDLPQGGNLGEIVFDINVGGARFAELGYADNDDFAFWPDEIAGRDMATAGTLLLPKYKATGFTGGLPCVEWGGASPALTTGSNPTAPYGSYTYYFVCDDLDGGDGARLWGGGFGDSFQYSLYFDGADFSGANNDAFGTPSFLATVAMGTPHIYRWVKRAPTVTQLFYVDGAMVANVACDAPQTNNDGRTEMMNYMAGLGIQGRVSRIVAYNRCHTTAAGDVGGQASGKTPVDTKLAGDWGTP